MKKEEKKDFSSKGERFERFGGIRNDLVSSRGVTAQILGIINALHSSRGDNVHGVEEGEVKGEIAGEICVRERRHNGDEAREFGLRKNGLD